MNVHAPEIMIERMASLGGGHWTLRNLTAVTVLFGKNGSGKSVLLRKWRDVDPSSVHYVVPERTGEMDFQPGYLQEESDGARRRNSAVRNFVTDYRRRIVGRIQSYFLTRGNTRGETRPPGDPAEIERLMASLLPDFELSLLADFPPYTLTRVDGAERVTGIDQLSSGEAQLVTLGLDILTIASLWEIQGTAQRILLIDEPDAHLHPDLLARLADFVLQVATRFGLQVVIATHSTGFLSALGQFGGRDTSVIYLDRRSTELRARPFDAIAKETAACLGGHALLGPLLGAPLLLVEGDDDYRIWSQVPRHHVTTFAVIPTNGDEIKKYQRTLEVILGSLRDAQARPLGYALLDGDKAVPESSGSNPQQFVAFVGMKCREAENLYLTAEVLQSLGTGWLEAARRVEQESGRFGSKASVLAEASRWDRRHGDLKAVMNEVATILDPKGLLWTQRVGTALGRQRPVGELAEFLGEGVVSALWPLPVE